MNLDVEINAATLWDDDQLIRWTAFGDASRRVGAVFGSRQQQVIGHGRAPADVPFVSDDRIERHSALARALGVEFLYLLNGRCDHLAIDDDPDVHARLVEDIDWVVQSVRATSVIVADLRVARLVRSRYSRDNVGIRVSTIAGVMTPADLEPWLPLDIDGVVLHHDAGRQFSLLQRFAATASQSGIHIELLLNESCLHGCTSRQAHYARLAGAPLDYVEGFQQNCNLPKFKDPSLLLSADWIRPEDVAYYRSLGIRRFKVAGREMPADWLDRAVRAYAEGSYHGNLVDLFTMTPPGLNVGANDVFYLDNDGLSGFLQRLVVSAKPARAFYRELALDLWNTGALRVNDPGASYDASRGSPRCVEPGEHCSTLSALRVNADPAYARGKSAAIS